MSQDNFLLDFNELCTGTEIPAMFAAWSGIAGVSCALSRRTWIDMGTFTVYPNMYICLVGGSGMVRKSTSIGMIERIIRQMEPQPNLIAQKITPEALIDALRTTESKDQTKLLLERCEGYVIADELSTFLNRNSYEAGLATLLIPLFDAKANFDYHTKTGGRQKITNSCLGILGGSTVDWLTAAIPEAAVGGGLTSRFIFVYVEKPANSVSRPWKDAATRSAKETLQVKLVHHMTRISMLQGEMKLTEQAWTYYDDEYERYKTSEEGLQMFMNKTLFGYASRRHIHQLKLAMVFSASERTDLVVTEPHIRAATFLLAQAEKYMPMLLNLITSTEQGALIQFVFNFIEREKRISRTALLRLIGHKMGVRELDVVIDTLIASGRVTNEAYGGVQYYRLTKENK